jgi:hypothetical protein
MQKLNGSEQLVIVKYHDLFFLVLLETQNNNEF